MKILKYTLSSLVLCLSLNAFAENPKEKIQLNSSYDEKGTSISVQEVGNKVLKQASSSKFLVFNYNGKEYAYSIKKLGSDDVKYSGKQSDISGLIFLDVTAYQDGTKLNSQLTVYRPSKYSNAIRLEKFDRDEQRPYQFDLGVDSENNIFIIGNVNNVTYLNNSNSIKKEIPFLETSKEVLF